MIKKLATEEGLAMIRAPVDDQTDGLELDRGCVELKYPFWTSLVFSQARSDKIWKNCSQYSLSDGGFMRSVDGSVLFWTFQVKHALKHQRCPRFRWPYTRGADSHLVLCCKHTRQYAVPNVSMIILRLASLDVHVRFHPMILERVRGLIITR